MRPRPLGRRGIALLVVLAITATVAVALRVEGHADPQPVFRSLTGITERGDKIALSLDRRGRVSGLDTRIRSVCAGGHPWSIHWTPAEGSPIHFRHRGTYVIAVERKQSYSNGELQRIGAGFEGRLGKGSASGNLRVVARFYRGSREVQACESGWVRWAVGPRAEQRLAFVTRPRFIRAYYPAVPSLASRVSRVGRSFIERVDRTCVREYNRIQRRKYESARRNARRPDALVRVWQTYVSAHGRELRAIVRLGPPPERRRVYNAWLQNMRQRVELEHRIVLRLRATDLRGARGLSDRVGRLKLAGNDAGQRFGLVHCTSNGPDRTPVLE